MMAWKMEENKIFVLGFEPSVQRSKILKVGKWNFVLGFEPSVQRSNSQKTENLPQALEFEPQK